MKMERKRPWLPIPDPLGIAEKLTENTPVQLRDPIRRILKEGRSPSKGNPDGTIPERVKRLRQRGYVP